MAHVKRLHPDQGELDLRVPAEVLQAGNQGNKGTLPIRSNVTQLVTNYRSEITINGRVLQVNVMRSRVKRDSSGKISELELRISEHGKSILVFKIFLKSYNIEHRRETVVEGGYYYIKNFDISSITKVSPPRIWKDKRGNDIENLGYFHYLEGILNLQGLIQAIKTELNNAILHFSRNSL